MRIIVEEMGEKKKERKKRIKEGEREGITCYAENPLIVMPASNLPLTVGISLSVCLSVNAYMKVIVYVFTKA